MKIPYPVLTKRTEEVPNWLPVVTSVGAVLMAFIISGIILKLIGADPIKVYRYFFKASFGSWGAFSDVLVKATPLILIGLGCALAFRMRLWNIGAEGQFFIGAFMATTVVMVPLVNIETTPKIVILG
jgi:simple sugar transport system permease protein